MRGDWEDYLVDEDGTRTLVGSGQNLVVSDAAVVIASAMLPRTTPINEGFLYWAVGDGNIDGSDTVPASLAWDVGVTAGTIVPLVSNQRLAREVFRKVIAPADVVFVDPSNAVSTAPTNRLRITSLFLEDEPSLSDITYLREWGLFGGSANRNGTGGAPSGVDTGFLINRKVHTTYSKSYTSRLERVIYFTF